MTESDITFIKNIHKEAWKLQQLKGDINYYNKFQEGITIPDFELTQKSFEELLCNKKYNFSPLTIKNYMSRYNKLMSYQIISNLYDSKKTMELLSSYYPKLHCIKTFLGFICSFIKIIPVNYRHKIIDLENYTNLLVYLTAIQHYISIKERHRMSVNETKNWVKLHILHKIIDYTKETKDYYNYILFYLYLKVCPLRTDLKTVKIKNFDSLKDNFIDGDKLVFNRIFKQKNKKLTFTIPNHLLPFIELYFQNRRDKDSEYLFPKNSSFSKQFNQNINFYYHLLYPNDSKNLTMQLIRKIIASETSINTPSELYSLATNMGHSVKIHQEVYVKPT